MKSTTYRTPPPPELDIDDDLLLLQTAPDVMTKSEPVIMTSFRQFVAKVPPDASKRSRIQFKFWLDARKLSDFQLSAWLDELKQGRQFTETIRDALRLLQDLRAGRYEVLRELFPTVFDRILAEHCQPASADFSALMREIADLKAQRPASEPQGSPQPNVSTIVDTSSSDTALLTVTKSESDGKAATANFFASLSMLNGSK